MWTTKGDGDRRSEEVMSLLPQGDALQPYDGDGGKPVIANPYGRVPIFHFANNADIGAMGTSEMASVIPVQDALNKSVLDMLIAMEFSAFRQRWITGVDVEYNDDGTAKSPFVPGADRIWMSENADAKFGDFEATDLEQFLKVKDGFRTDMATVSGTPLHYFMLTGASFPQSGISIEKLESRFLNKVRDRQEAFGAVWEDVMSFAMEIENRGKAVRLFTEWNDPSRLSESEELDNLLKKQTLGVGEAQLLTEAGYGADDIARMTAEKAAAHEAMAAAFNAGETE